MTASEGDPRPVAAAAGPAVESLGPIGEQLRDALRRGWRWLLVSGILAIAAGAVAIAVPAAASVTTEIFVGWLIVFASAFLLVDALSPPRTAGRVILRLLYAAIFLFVGIYLLVAPLEGTFTLTVVLAAWLIAMGVLRLFAALRERHVPGAGLVALNGLASLALGVLIAAELPSSADWAIGLLVGIDFLFYGLAAIWTAVAGRELARAVA